MGSDPVWGVVDLCREIAVLTQIAMVLLYSLQPRREKVGLVPGALFFYADSTEIGFVAETFIGIRADILKYQLYQ